MKKTILFIGILQLLFTNNSFSEETAGAYYRYFSGKLDKYPIQLTLIKNNNEKDPHLTGFYSYDSEGIKYLTLDGGYDGDFYKNLTNIFVAESTDKEKVTGSLEGKILDNNFTGTWLPKGEGKELKFNLKAPDYTKTIIKDSKAKKSLLKNTKISLQWISFNDYEKIKVFEKDNKVFMKGRYNSKKVKGDFLEIDGFFTSIDKYQLNFNGKITMQINHIFSGMPCQRLGDFTFKKYNGRNYWRMQEMKNPCDVHTDYIDIAN
ncbi:MAG: hypothetical protein U0457_10910 [Candidatus Sericytochromatia bacterium]